MRSNISSLQCKTLVGKLTSLIRGRGLRTSQTSLWISRWSTPFKTFRFSNAIACGIFPLKQFLPIGADLGSKVIESSSNSSISSIITLNFPFFRIDEPLVLNLECPASIIEGHNATLHCNATGNPPPNINWIRKDTGDVLGTNEQQLTLLDVHRSQAGTYQCFAWTGISNSSISTCQLDVFCESINCNVFSARISWGACPK